MSKRNLKSGDLVIFQPLYGKCQFTHYLGMIKGEIRRHNEWHIAWLCGGEGISREQEHNLIKIEKTKLISLIFNI